mgnify:FL=1
MTREAKILAAIFGVIVVGMIAIFAFAGGGGSTADSNSDTVDQSKLVRPDSHKAGNGPVQVVEFGDYQCPACAAAEPNVQKLKEEMGDKITFVYRNFPLPIHKNAMPAAEAAEAAGAQGKYWEMHSKLYTTQTEWENLPNPVDKFAEYAKELGLDADKLKKDVEENKYVDFINQDKRDGEDIGVNATPTFYINGKKAESFDYATLKSMVEEALNQK